MSPSFFYTITLCTAAHHMRAYRLSPTENSYSRQHFMSVKSRTCLMLNPPPKPHNVPHQQQLCNRFVTDAAVFV